MQRMFNWRTRVLPQRGVSTENLIHNTSGDHTVILRRTKSKTEFELTSLHIHQLLDKKKYQKIVDLLRELSYTHILQCLESFPFKALNKAIPESFPVWETLLTKLHNSEEGYIPQFPYAACDELVIRVAHILAYMEHDTHQNEQLYLQCRRVLKKVYMQYHDVLEHLMKENERLSKALYAMTLHIPLGTDIYAVSLQQAIRDEVSASLVDFRDAIERLEELFTDPIPLSFEIVPHKNSNGYSSGAHSLTQIQIQERLYSNQCTLGCMNPVRRKDNLSQLLEMLNARIHGDKEILAIFADLRNHIPHITEKESVEPWLRRYQHSIECAITLFREIEDELAINSPSTSPEKEELELPQNHVLTPSPIPPPLTIHSTTPQDYRQYPENDEIAVKTIKRYRSSSEKISQIRPSSLALLNTSKMSQSSHSVDKTTTFNKLEESTSVQDIPYVTNASPTNYHHLHGNGQTIAGIKKKFGPLRRSLRYSMRRLSSSAGNVSSKKKRMYRTGSNGSSGEDDCEQLELAKKELMEARQTVNSLRKRERVLTDRLSEQAQRHLQDGDKFEDILMGASRPSIVMQRYQELYSQERVEAYEGMLDMDHLVDKMIIPEFLIDVLKMAYAAAECNLESLHHNWKRTLCIGETNNYKQTNAALQQLESAVSIYIRKVSPSHNPQDIIKMVQWDLEKKYKSLPFFHTFIDIEAVNIYIEESAKLCWDLVVQSPPMVPNYKEMEFIPELHIRFHSSDKDSTAIVTYQWPILMQGGNVLLKGVVIT